MLKFRAFIKNNWHIILSEFLVFIAFIAFLGRFGDLMVDSYGEVYIPQQILKGEVVYKDIFLCISSIYVFINMEFYYWMY